MMNRTEIALFGALLIAPVACVGNIGDGAPGEPVNPPLSNPNDLEAPDCTDVGPPMIRRLTSTQLHNAMVDLFGDASVPTTDVLTDPVVLGFKVDATQAVIRDLNAQQIMVQAERVAEWAAQSKLGELSPCQSHDAACYRSFVEQFGRRAYRQPVPPTSLEAYVATGLAEPTFTDGAEAVMATILQSPYFLYRHELGEADGEDMVRLTADEVAQNLAFTLTDMPPDDTLVSAAREGRLETPEDLVREAKRLLHDAASDAPLAHFVSGWLEVDDLGTRTKTDPTMQYTADIGASMSDETATFFRHVVRDGGSFSDLLTAPYTFVNQPLAGYYGLPGSGDTAMQQVTLPPDQRPFGLLGHGSFLARHALADTSSPVQRGVVVRERFLCQELPDPPASVDTNLTPPQNPTTTRAHYEQHREDPTCNTCHQLIDPIGFAFENWDAFARFRDNENGHPIDSSGALTGTADGDVALDGVDSLSEALAGSSEAEACFRRFLSYYAYGLDGCNQEAIANATGGSAAIEDVVVAFVTAPHFTRRRRE